MTIKQLVAGTVVAGAAMMAGPAMALDLTGNVGAFSSYMFRGVDQAGVAAIQGGIDATAEGGLYAGVWASNLADGESEVDLYVGYTIGTLDIGYVFYGYPESTKLNSSEIYVAYGIGNVALQAFYSPEYGDTEDESFYVSASYAHALSETLSLTPQVGYSFGDGIETGLLAGAEDSYIDFSLALTKSLDNDFEFSFGVYGNSEKELLGKEKLVVSLKKTFDL